MQAKYDGPPLDDRMKHLAERDFDEEAEKAEVPGAESYQGDNSTEFSVGGLLTKKQRVAKISAETGITDYQELYDHICSNYEFDTARSYVYQILNSDVEVEGFEVTDGGAEFDNPVADIKQAIIRKARLNPELSHAEIQEAVSESQGVELKYSWVRRVIHRHTNWDRVQKGHKKEAIVEVFADTGLKSRQLAEEVERRKGIEVSTAYINMIANNGELDGYDDIEGKPTKKDYIVGLAERHNTTDIDEVYELVKEETDIETKRSYVREVLYESRSKDDDGSETSANPSTQEEMYSRSEIEDKVLKPIVTAKQSATEEEARCLEECEKLVNSMLNEGGESER